MFYFYGDGLIPENEKNLHTWYTVTHCFLSVLLFCTTKLQFRVRVYIWLKCKSGIVSFGPSKSEFKIPNQRLSFLGLSVVLEK